MGTPPNRLHFSLLPGRVGVGRSDCYSLVCEEDLVGTTQDTGMSWWRKWWAWLRPRKGWREDYRRFKGGKNVWPVPGNPEADNIVPFPLYWIPHRLSDHPRGFDFLEATCADTGKHLPVGVGVRCLRCQVDLHPSAANMIHGFSAPYCKRCAVLISLVIL